MSALQKQLLNDLEKKRVFKKNFSIYQKKLKIHENYFYLLFGLDNSDLGEFMKCYALFFINKGFVTVEEFNSNLEAGVFLKTVLKYPDVFEKIGERYVNEYLYKEAYFNNAKKVIHAHTVSKMGIREKNNVTHLVLDKMIYERRFEQ